MWLTCPPPVPLHVAAITEQKINAACQRFGISLETWRLQERAFGLMRKVYAKRATIRGQQPSSVVRDRDSVDIAPLQLGEEVARVHLLARSDEFLTCQQFLEARIVADRVPDGIDF